MLLSLLPWPGLGGETLILFLPSVTSAASSLEEQHSNLCLNNSFSAQYFALIHSWGAWIPAWLNRTSTARMKPSVNIPWVSSSLFLHSQPHFLLQLVPAFLGCEAELMLQHRHRSREGGEVGVVELHLFWDLELSYWHPVKHILGLRIPKWGHVLRKALALQHIKEGLSQRLAFHSCCNSSRKQKKKRGVTAKSIGLAQSSFLLALCSVQAFWLQLLMYTIFPRERPLLIKWQFL